MHWAMMLNAYGTAILHSNPQITEAQLVRALIRWLDIADDDGRPSLADYAYPEPEAPHPVGDEPMARKIRQAQRQAGKMPIYALAHGYGPLADFRRRLQTAWKAAHAGIWINRYGYLADAKLAAVSEICRQPPD
jgi:hypothetical protein